MPIQGISFKVTDIVDMNLNISCKHFMQCRSYNIRCSELKDPSKTYPIHQLTGCPSMNETPDECSFYKEMIKYEEITNHTSICSKKSKELHIKFQVPEKDGPGFHIHQAAIMDGGWIFKGYFDKDLQRYVLIYGRDGFSAARIISMITFLPPEDCKECHAYLADTGSGKKLCLENIDFEYVSDFTHSLLYRRV